MLNKGQKVIRVTGKDPSRVQQVQESTGDPNRVIELEEVTGDAARYKEVQVVASGDPSRVPRVRFTTTSVTAFTDNFNRANENLEASANWTRVGGVAGAAAVSSNEVVGTTNTATAYQCPDQGSANHYTQVAIRHVNTGSFQACVRLADASNYIGVRANAGAFQLYKNNTGVFTLLGSYSAVAPVLGDVVRVEASGNDITVKINGVTRIGPVTDAFNNTQTRQGLAIREAVALIDDFEAGRI